jgi:hypothetical protein
MNKPVESNTPLPVNGGTFYQSDAKTGGGPFLVIFW